MIDRLRRECCQISAAYVILTSPVEQASKEKRGEEVKKGGGGALFSLSPSSSLFCDRYAGYRWILRPKKWRTFRKPSINMKNSKGCARGVKW